MDHNTMITDGSAKLTEVLARTRPFNAADYVQFRQAVADLKRDEHVDMALFAYKLDEIYACAERIDMLRKKMPEGARPIRKILVEIARKMAAIDRVLERMAKEVGGSDGT